MGSRLEILAEFGYARDPFRAAVLETADQMRVTRVIKMAVDSKAMISVVADRGCGKTSAISAALRGAGASVVKLQSCDKERTRIGDIETAMILELSTENVKRTREIRARQLKRILGERAKQQPVVLILEEAHRMYSQTLRSLKTLREMEWLGASPLFTVVMVGQYDPMQKRGVDEVRLRTDTIHMKGLTGGEIKDYIAATVSRCFEADAVEAISRLSEARNFLDLQEIILRLMEKALQDGQKQVTVFEVFSVYGGGVKEMLKTAGINQVELEKETGIPRSTLNQVINEKQGTMTDEKFSDVRQSISAVLKKRASTGKPESGPGLRAV